MVIIFYMQHAQMIAASFLRTKNLLYLKILDKFSFFSGLKQTEEKCEVAGIGIKKRIKVALCGMKNIDFQKIQ